MQFIGAFFTEIINILVICNLPTIMDIIMNFIALGVISEIDNYYLASLAICPLKAALENPLKVTKSNKNYESFFQRPWNTWIVQFFYKSLRIF